MSQSRPSNRGPVSGGARECARAPVVLPMRPQGAALGRSKRRHDTKSPVDLGGYVCDDRLKVCLRASIKVAGAP